MPTTSSFSNLKFELITTGEQSGSWGNTTNTNIGTAIEQAIVGMATLDAGDFTANVATLTLSNSNAAQDARALCLLITSSAVTGNGIVNVPAIQKPYIVINQTSYTITVKVSGLTGVAVPANKRSIVYNNGTDVGSQVDYLPTLALGTALPVASGGTGSAFVTAGRILIGNGSSSMTEVAPGTAGNVLTSVGGAWASAVPALSPSNTITWSGAQTFTGGMDTSASLQYQGPTKQKVTSISASTSTTTVDLSLSDSFIITVSANTSLVFSNAPTDGTMKSFNLIIKNTSTGGYAVSFPGTVSWAGGVLPPRTTTANAKDLWAFFTVDGTNYAGSLSIQNY